MKSGTRAVLILVVVLGALYFVGRAVGNKQVAQPAASAAPAAPAESAISDEQRQELWILEMQRRVAKRLRNPDNAQFSDSRVSRKSGPPVVCGRVNAENGFGGKTGSQRFVAAGDIIALEEEMGAGEMDKTWQQVCG